MCIQLPPKGITKSWYLKYYAVLILLGIYIDEFLNLTICVLHPKHALELVIK